MNCSGHVAGEQRNPLVDGADGLVLIIRGPAKSTPVNVNAGASFILHSGSGGAFERESLKLPTGHTLMNYLPNYAPSSWYPVLGSLLSERFLYPVMADTFMSLLHDQGGDRVALGK